MKFKYVKVKFELNRTVFLLVYVLQLFSSVSAVTYDNSQIENLRTKPRQARLALQELNLIPGPDNGKRPNDKFLRNPTKVI